MQLSVITINYNNKDGLIETIESVKSQTLPNFEYIIIDGGSSDGSVDVLEENNSKIKFWVSEADNGIYHAMNKGIRKASGQYLLFLNSGDTLVSEDVLENMVNEEVGTTDLVYGNLKRTFPDGTQDIVAMPDFISVDTMMTWTLCHPVTLIHRRLFQDFGLYDERLKIVADWAFFLKVIVLGNATQKHKNVTVANFSMDGMSSIPENQGKIYAEREWVKSQYFSPAFIEFYKDYSIYKDFYFSRWIQRLRSLNRILKGRNG